MFQYKSSTSAFIVVLCVVKVVACQLKVFIDAHSVLNILPDFTHEVASSKRSVTLKEPSSFLVILLQSLLK
ncbi:hypothetical protein IJS64_04055 [bacterium]|nr:hypothetical protein [bacterium]MBR4568062.1 hypothetical protein [bacterium]